MKESWRSPDRSHAQDFGAGFMDYGEEGGRRVPQRVLIQTTFVWHSSARSGQNEEEVGLRAAVSEEGAGSAREEGGQGGEGEDERGEEGSSRDWREGGGRLRQRGNSRAGGWSLSSEERRSEQRQREGRWWWRSRIQRSLKRVFEALRLHLILEVACVAGCVCVLVNLVGLHEHFLGVATCLPAVLRQRMP